MTDRIRAGAFQGQGQRLGDGAGAYGRAPGGNDGDDGFSCDPSGLVDNPAVLGGGACCLILCALLAVMSLGSVPPLTYAIRYNHFTKAAHTETVYEPGRYFIGPFNKFLLFPSTVQTIEFTSEPRLSVSGIRYEPLHTRTKEGLGLHLQVSLQFRLMKENLGKLYNEFNLNYEQVFTSSVRDVLIKAASEYEATQLWEERDKFGDRMQSMVDHELRKTYGECWGLQLMIIDLPDNFEHSITMTQVQKQQMLMNLQEQLSAKIRAETSVIAAEYARQVKVIMANGQANYTITTKQAQAEAEQNKINLESEVFGYIKGALALTADDLILYQKYGAMEDLESASLYYGFSGASKVLVQGGASR